ncbi:MAG: antitoxin [Sulfurimonas sp. RIFOXYD12_FULL_33_39]|uniref:HepT-like ribonuclease domain-containing protein n=1 Tax=unclassified Sulfurimonas TaxID=2623549 RepID=UPI0008BD7750|nr:MULTISPECIES: HepT-like ribonuclease domain-containing protein [unclassified Sulfurimonas]OHE10064.1 MAG: antitoxin [Sulfurimonas sp. RIFOXYD12_FULL_33_39]OHE14715.1 MAG: antitoxin [Sulfurimonas sp. RIFOXYD2_FULL_34_21]
MSDERKLMILSTLEDIKHSLELIQKRSKHISSSDDFLKNDDGLEKLDSISMRLVAIGEGFKNIDKLSDNRLLSNYPNIPWKKVKGVRDILSHHYFDLDAEAIFNICDNEIDKLLQTTIEIIDDIQN